MLDEALDKLERILARMQPEEFTGLVRESHEER